MRQFESASMGRPTTRMWWWAVSVLLILVGILGFIFGPRTPAEGPNISQPVGQTQLSPSQYKNLVGSSLTTTSSLSSSSSLSGAIPVSLASYSVPTSASLAPSSSSSAAESAKARRARTAIRILKRSRPVHLSIPEIGVNTSLGMLGLNADNTVQVPTNFAQPGWYKLGPSPGQKGSSVILGHVDNYKGPAVFFYVNKLKKGNPVMVTLKNGYVVHFKVIGVREYSKNNFPDQLVYGMRPYPALQLVTCGGVFDHATGHYESNIVAFTVMTGFSKPHHHHHKKK